MTWSPKDGKLCGLLIAHVDDLLCVGDEEAESSLLAVGGVLGFGSIERDDVQWCGKQIRQGHRRDQDQHGSVPPESEACGCGT